MPVPVCCMFFVSQQIHIKRSPNGIKTDGDFFWNICDFWEKESTRDDDRGGHEAGGAPQGVRRALDPRGNIVRWLEPFFRRKKDQSSRPNQTDNSKRLAQISNHAYENSEKNQILFIDKLDHKPTIHQSQQTHCKK